MNQALVYDVGMYDGVDTAYYLANGFRVVAVEANPFLVERARQRFDREIRSGQLVVENVAIGDSVGTLTLHLCQEDLGSSSVTEGRLARRTSAGVVQVPSLPFVNLLSRYGIPHYLKCDIEGSDRHCILGLGETARPVYVSFEMGDDAIELLDHLGRIGYNAFKITNQHSFNELAMVNSLTDRIIERLKRVLRFPDTDYVVRDGFRFTRGHSSGPMAEHTDGRWRSIESTRFRWQEFCAAYPLEQRPGWYDLHARCA